MNSVTPIKIPPTGIPARDYMLNERNLMFKIFSELDHATLYNCYLVCRRWKVISVDSRLWWPILRRAFPPELFPVEQGTDPREKLIEFRKLMECFRDPNNHECEVVEDAFNPHRLMHLQVRNGNLYVMNEIGINVWDLEKREITQSFTIQPRGSTFEFFKDWIVCGHDFSDLTFWDVNTGELIRSLTLIPDQWHFIESMVTNGNSLYVLCTVPMRSDNQLFRVDWDPDTGDFLVQVPIPILNWADTLKIFDGQVCFFGSTVVYRLDEKQRTFFSIFHSNISRHLRSFDVVDKRVFVKGDTYCLKYLDGRLYYTTKEGLNVEELEGNTQLVKRIPTLLKCMKITNGIIIIADRTGSLYFLYPISRPQKKRKVLQSTP